MSYKVDIIADSISVAGARITTMQLRYPRMIHAEFMTHRAFSRNASSSRAIPVKKLIEDIKLDPAMPVFWGRNQPGMQAGEDHHEEVITGFGSDDYVFGSREDAWLAARDEAVKWATVFSQAGYHKQIVNRLLEPWSHINVVVTATEWDNFFDLRCHKDAQPEIRVLAEMMRDALSESTPTPTGLHLPYILQPEKVAPVAELKLVSSARCARVSYMTHDNKEPDWDADLALSSKLSGAPPHLSPFEHQADASKDKRGQFANFRGWYSQRYVMERSLVQHAL